MSLTKELEIKADLLIEGMQIEEPVLEGVGTLYKENINWLFDYNFIQLSPGLQIPGDLILPKGTYVQVRINPKSPYLIRKEDDTLVLEKYGHFVSTLRWCDRPEYYNKATSDGIEMRKIIYLRGDCCLAVCHSLYCVNWEDDLQCRFCNMNAAHQGNADGLPMFKKAEQVGEVAAAVYQEGIDFHLVLSGGSLSGTKVADQAHMLIESIRHHTGLEKIPGCADVAPSRDLQDVERIHATGIPVIGYNIEVWNPHMFEVICPGKSRNVGRENYLKALDVAVPLYGRGNVFTVFVLGLEDKDTILEGVQYFAERGVFPALAPWIPMVGSKLEGHRPPQAEWMLEVNEKAIDIVEKSLPEVMTVEFFKSGNLGGCYRCNSITLYWDEIRRRIGEPEITMRKDRQQQTAAL